MSASKSRLKPYSQTYNLHLWDVLPVECVEDTSANHRSHEPSQASTAEGDQTQCDERIQWHLADNLVHIRDGQHLCASQHAKGSCSHRRTELETAAGLAKLEECVPVKRWMCLSLCRCCCCRCIADRCVQALCVLDGSSGEGRAC